MTKLILLSLVITSNFAHAYQSMEEKESADYVEQSVREITAVLSQKRPAVICGFRRVGGRESALNELMQIIQGIQPPFTLSSLAINSANFEMQSACVTISRGG